MAAFTFNTVPSTVFGPGAIARVGGIAALLGPRAAVEAFDGVVADPPEAVALAAVALADARAIAGAAW
jgi:hypothetical protein